MNLKQGEDEIVGSSLKDLLKSSGFREEILSYAKSRHFSIVEVRAILTQAINETFETLEIDHLKNLNVTYLADNTLQLKRINPENGSCEVVNPEDIDLGSLFNHVQFYLGKKIISSFKIFQIQKLQENIDFKVKLYEVEVLRIGKDFIMAEMLHLHRGIEV